MIRCKKFLAMFLIVSMIVSLSGVTTFAFDETENTVSESEPLENNEDNQDVTEIPETNGDEKIADVTTQQVMGEKVSEKQKDFEYVYVDEQTVNIPEEQNIVVAFADTEMKIESATLHGSLVESNTAFDMEVNNIVNNTVLFTKNYTEREETGTYKLDSISYKIQGEEAEINVAFADQEIDAGYTVTEEPEKGAAVEESGEVPEVSVYSLDEEGNTIEEIGDTNDIENSVEAVLSTVDDEAMIDTYSTRAGRKVIVICAGHDASHPGASGNGLREEQLTFKVAQYCKTELEQYSGVTVYLDRNSVACAYPGQSSNYCLNQRVIDAAAKGANVFVDIHFNIGGGTGAEVYVPNNSYSTAIHQDGESLGNNILAQLSALGLRNRGTKVRDCTTNDRDPNGILEDYYTSINASKAYGMTGIIVEHAFLDNANDAAKLKNESFLQEIGIADAKGIAATYGLSKGKWELDSIGWRFKYEDGSYLTNSWLYTGAWYHFDEKGYMQTGWLVIKSGKYYLNPNGDMVTGWKKIDNIWYYFNDSGAMTTGWQKVKDKWYYMNENGEMQTGWVDVNGKRYYLDENGAMYTGKQKIEGVDYQFGADGSLQGTYEIKTGWKKIDNIWYYYIDDQKVTGWKYIKNIWYYFNDSGAMTTGWQKVKDKWYYMNENGEMQTGWINVNGKRYYLDENGVMYTGKQRIEGVDYQFGADGSLQSSYEKKNGWKKIDNIWYYYIDDEKATGWKYIKNIWYYMNEKGEMQTGWQKVKDRWYYMNENGEMQTGWITIKSGRYYLNPNGDMVTGWKKIDNIWYYFNDSGAMTTGWQNIKDKWYYMNENGEMQVGWQKVKDKWYYMNEDGTMQTGWISIKSGRYYLNPNGDMATGYLNIDGTWYYFNKTENPEGALSYTGITEIMGTSKLGTTKDQVVSKLVKMYNNQGKTYPSKELKKGGAENITEFCGILYDEAVEENVKPEIVFGQAMKETGFLQFGGDVKIEQFNFAGIGAAGNGAKGASFADVKTGLRAQVQHLKAYASSESLKNKCVDPRFNLVTRNTAPYVEWLGIKENPNGRGWAAASGYGISLMKSYVNPIYQL